MLTMRRTVRRRRQDMRTGRGAAEQYRTDGHIVPGRRFQQL
jgi:hypothetical protein